MGLAFPYGINQGLEISFISPWRDEEKYTRRFKMFEEYDDVDLQA